MFTGYADQPSFAVELTELLEWQLAASSRSSSGSGRSTDGRSNSVWLVTPAARYRLLAPAEAYADVLAKAIHKAGAAGRDAAAVVAADGMLHQAGVDLPAMGALSARWLPIACFGHHCGPLIAAAQRCDHDTICCCH